MNEEYNGHKDWTHWNVSLWIHNEESFYKWARELAREMGEDKAAAHIVDAMDGETTPDGAQYTLSAVREAITDILK